MTAGLCGTTCTGNRTRLTNPATAPGLTAGRAYFRRTALGSRAMPQATMKAVGFRKPLPIEAPDALVDLTLPVPSPAARDLLVSVRAIAVNPVDVKVRASATPPAGEARVIGWDAAGVVEAVGPECTLFRPGDEVFYAGTILRPGCNAEYQLVDERLVGPKPKSLDFPEAASLPLTSVTAYELLFDRLRVPYGKKTGGGRLLVVNGAGGVGSILIQMAKRLSGLEVIATASRPETIDWVKSLGADHVIDHKRPLHEELKRIGIPEVEYITSLSGSDQHAAAYVEALAPEGHLALIDDPKTFDVMPFKRKSITVCWELMFTRSIYGRANMVEQHRALSEVSALVDAGVLRHTLKERVVGINAETLRRAHQKLESGSTVGKIVLTGF